MQSKKGVSANIEKQEVANQQNAAKVEMQLDQAKMSEQLRLQGISMSEAKRMQQAEASGKDYVFKATEIRQGEQLERAQTQVENSQAAVASYQQARDGAIGSAISGLGAVASSVGGLVEERKEVKKAALQKVADRKKEIDLKIEKYDPKKDSNSDNATM